MVQDAGIRKAGISDQGSGNRDQGLGALQLDPPLLPDRVRELEAENTRLRCLVGELLVTNQLLRECREQAARSSKATQ
jgi:hypothetical protein